MKYSSAFVLGVCDACEHVGALVVLTTKKLQKKTTEDGT